MKNEQIRVDSYLLLCYDNKKKKKLVKKVVA